MIVYGISEPESCPLFYGTADSCINSSWNFQMLTSDSSRKHGGTPTVQKDVIARVTLRKAHEQFPTDVVVEASQLKRGLYVGRTLLPQRHRDVRVCVANTTEKPPVDNSR